MTADAQAHWLPFDSYLTALERETARLRECVETADPRAQVPSCPDWDVDDLLWHVGGEVQDFWAWVIAHRPEAPDAYEEPARPADRDGLLRILDHAHEDLMLRLRNADPADGAWSWSGDRDLHTVGFTIRRQAHEALIHRVDAELAVGDPTPLDTELAADGVLEALDWMYGGLPRWARFAPDGDTVVVHMTDTGRRVLVGLGRVTGHDPDDGADIDQAHLRVIDRAAHGHVDADAVISGTAQGLDLWLWHRGPAHAVEMEGDERVIDRLTAVLGEPVD